MPLSFKQGTTIAKETNMRYGAPYWPHELNAHVFDEKRMINCCRVTHTFYLAESIEDCLARKLAAIEETKE